MSSLHVNHLRARIERDYEDKIDMSDMKDKSSEDYQSHFLSRGFAAYSLSVLTGIDCVLSANAIVDGFDDNGIDAIYYDEAKNELWLVQSKWIKDGNGEPPSKETQAFCSGIKDLIDMKLDRFNGKVNSKSDIIQNALDNAKIQIKIVLAHTGNQFGRHNQRAIDDLLVNMNDPTELCEFINFNLKIAHKSLVDVVDGSPIYEDVVIANWGMVNEPYQSFYGQVNIQDVGNWWISHRSKLVSDNIRGFIGSTEVNNEILRTVKDQPEMFWYFNNGITALCESIAKKPLGGNDRSSGIFEVNGLKIVNGAQTVGCLGEFFSKNPHIQSNATVMVRFIALNRCPPDFSIMITKATNTQNKVEKKDFVSLDDQQERLRTDFALEGIIYQYKRSVDNCIEDDMHCSFEELIVALSCKNSLVDHCILAKREVGKLWDDVTKRPYIEFFNSGLSTNIAWNSIMVHRKITNYLRINSSKYIGRERGVYIHANLFIEHLIFQVIDATNICGDRTEFEVYFDTLMTDRIQDFIDRTHRYLEENYGSSLIHQLFRNYTKTREIEQFLLGEIC